MGEPDKIDGTCEEYGCIVGRSVNLSEVEDEVGDEVEMIVGDDEIMEQSISSAGRLKMPL